MDRNVSVLSVILHALDKEWVNQHLSKKSRWTGPMDNTTPLQRVQPYLQTIHLLSVLVKIYILEVGVAPMGCNCALHIRNACHATRAHLPVGHWMYGLAKQNQNNVGTLVYQHLHDSVRVEQVVAGCSVFAKHSHSSMFFAAGPGF